MAHFLDQYSAYNFTLMSTQIQIIKDTRDELPSDKLRWTPQAPIVSALMLDCSLIIMQLPQYVCSRTENPKLGSDHLHLFPTVRSYSVEFVKFEHSLPEIKRGKLQSQSGTVQYDLGKNA